MGLFLISKPFPLSLESLLGCTVNLLIWLSYASLKSILTHFLSTRNKVDREGRILHNKDFREIGCELDSSNLLHSVT
jgi:hypothetical protein